VWLALGIGLLGVGSLAGLVLPRRICWLLAAGLVWQLPFLLLYIVVRNAIGGYGLYTPLAGLALLVAGVVEGARLAWRSVWGVRRPRAVFGAVGLLVLTTACGVLLLGEVWASPMVRHYREWEDAAAISDSYVSQLRACLAAWPDATWVVIDGYPFNLDYGTDESRLIDARVLAEYSFASLLRVYGDGDRFGAVRGPGFPVTQPTTHVDVSCQNSPERLLVLSRAG
jgi:hypothetical protein